MKKFLLFLSALFAASHINAQACTGAPAANTAIATSTNICVGTTVTLSLQNAYTATGIVYQWAYATATQFGPWTAIGGANAANLITNTLSQAGWYTCVIGCSNSFMTATATPVYITVNAGGAVASVPYYEGFNTPVANGLPNCSWSASNLGTNCLSFTSPLPNLQIFGGGGVAGFSYSATALGTYDFFSQGLNLTSGITYSVGVFQSSNNFQGSTNWSQFGIGINTAQTAAGSTVLYNTNSPSTGPYALRSATFTMPTSGVYYIRLYATSVSGAVVAQYLTFDDLVVTAPCTLGNNGGSALISSTANIGPNGITLCAGDSALVNFLPTTNCVMVSPASNTKYVTSSAPGINAYTYAVTNTLTSCTNVSTLNLMVSPAPNVFATANSPVICNGYSTVIQAFGAPNHTLMPGSLVGNSFTVTPTSTSVYTLIGTNQNSCSATTTIAIIVTPNPQITLGADTLQACAGESPNIAVTGANGYTCSYQGAINGTSLITLPQVSSSGTISITGANSNQCTTTKSFYLKVDACAGLSQLTGTEQLRVYPNPAHTTLFIEQSSGNDALVYTLQGQLVLQQQIQNGTGAIDISKLASGVYYLKISNHKASQTLRFVKEN